MQFNSYNQTNIQNKPIYNVIIDRYEVFSSFTYRSYLKLICHLWNENESFEIDQVFELYDDGSVHQSFYEFVDQFRQFGEVKDDVTVEDLIGEKGTCTIKHHFSNGKVYQKIVLTSWEDNTDEY